MLPVLPAGASDIQVAFSPNGGRQKSVVKILPTRFAHKGTTAFALQIVFRRVCG
jgi:hypothetical protein